MDESKRRALDDAIAKIEKEYGKGAIMRLGENANLHLSLIHI